MLTKEMAKCVWVFNCDQKMSRKLESCLIKWRMKVGSTIIGDTMYTLVNNRKSI